MPPEPGEVLLTADQIAEAVRRMARAISADYRGRPPVVVGVLTGSVVFLADLIRLLTVPCRVEFVRAGSYRGPTTEAGRLDVRIDRHLSFGGQRVLLVDDILDTGATLRTLVDRLAERGAADVRVAVLLRKRGRQTVALEPDYGGVEIPNRFVVGYGLDYDGWYRHLPYIAAMDDDSCKEGNGNGPTGG